MDDIATKLEKAIKSSNIEDAVSSVLKNVIKKHKKVCFDGDGYSDDWKEEAKKRGLPILRTCADALPSLKTKRSLEIFEKYKVLSNRELEARVDVLEEQYVTNKEIEARTLISMMNTQIIPAAEVYQFELARTINTTQIAGKLTNMGTQVKKLNEITNLIAETMKLVEKLENQEKKDLSPMKVKDFVIPLMEKIRKNSDTLEGILPDEIWPIPKYSEMLFLM